MTALNPFRKHDSRKPLHARWGDVAISAPTEGSWSQYNNPHQSSHRKLGYGPGFVPDCSPRSRQSSDEDETTSTDTTPSSRRNSFSISTLNPRRLSMRLGPRSKAAAPDTHHDEDDRLRHFADQRSEFAYKPIRQDYLNEVAEKTTAQHHDRRASRFRYIPASTRYNEELGSLPPRSPSVSSRGSSRKYSVEVEPVHGHEYGSGYYDDENDYCDDYRSSSRSSHKNSFDPRRASGIQGGRVVVANPAVGRKKASSRLTMTMVPDAEDLYE
ncbi:hypothetical protein ASPWEDRAFT_239330 [Aspergillus wentii DTO 134E9]|uniref:Uncharacterized protein n=1 Tax=Aspergillus wentii DTO 134E9 TaxID=1073089 RepID=A0A1L9S1G9_ASPWE|nr:uncharacterized protein ASPWEDRAFT_239330 [Aspergillus wentii DTO 134E9]KAI9931011.1 hypothetical protein MW887_010666 [Aspergillus wentii]OJJ40995.1 hypothetical protein ASPWEDRAFT_239330 [Aspergillus wentii DTO 134E9]